jgi:Chalcone isomerase-like
MSRNFFVLALLCPLFTAASPAQAGVLSPQGAKGELEGVKLVAGAKGQVAGRSYDLKAVGAGLRFKKVAFVKAKVYVGELLLDAPEKFQKAQGKAVESLEQEKGVAIRMTFLRDVDGETVQKGFREGLEANGANLGDTAVQGFLEAVKSGGQAKDGKAIVVIGERLPDGKETVTYENVDGKATTVTGSAGLVKSIFSIWLGKVGDSGLENLQKGLLGG